MSRERKVGKGRGAQFSENKCIEDVLKIVERKEASKRRRLECSLVVHLLPSHMLRSHSNSPPPGLIERIETPNYGRLWAKNRQK